MRLHIQLSDTVPTGYGAGTQDLSPSLNGDPKTSETCIIEVEPRGVWGVGYPSFLLLWSMGRAHKPKWRSKCPLYSGSR